jgi:anti-sigma B factor antagonist
MKLDYTRLGDVTVLEFSGEFDAFNLHPVAKAVDDIIEQGETRLIFQLRKLTFLNSSALGYLIKARKKAQAAGGDAVLAEPSRFVRKLLATVGLDKLFSIYDDTDSAVRHFGGGLMAPGSDLTGEETDESLLGANAIIFTIEVEGRPRKYIGKIASLYADGLKFRWEVPGWNKEARPPLSTANFDKVVTPGSAIPVKFRQPFLVQGKYFEMATALVRATRDTLDDGRCEALFTIKYQNAKADDIALLKQFVSDMESFRAELSNG